MGEHGGKKRYDGPYLTFTLPPNKQRKNGNETSINVIANNTLGILPSAVPAQEDAVQAHRRALEQDGACLPPALPPIVSREREAEARWVLLVRLIGYTDERADMCIVEPRVSRRHTFSFAVSGQQPLSAQQVRHQRWTMATRHSVSRGITKTALHDAQVREIRLCSIALQRELPAIRHVDTRPSAQRSALSCPAIPFWTSGLCIPLCDASSPS